MSLKGGYKIVDFKGKALSTTAVVIPGIYDAIEGNYSKPLLASGIVITISGLDTEYADEYIVPTVSSGDYNITFHGYTIAIDDDDKVTATAIVESKKK